MEKKKGAKRGAGKLNDRMAKWLGMTEADEWRTMEEHWLGNS